MTETKFIDDSDSTRPSKASLDRACVRDVPTASPPSRTLPRHKPDSDSIGDLALHIACVGEPSRHAISTESRSRALDLRKTGARSRHPIVRRGSRLIARSSIRARRWSKPSRKFPPERITDIVPDALDFISFSRHRQHTATTAGQIASERKLSEQLQRARRECLKAMTKASNQSNNPLFAGCPSLVQSERKIAWKTSSRLQRLAATEWLHFVTQSHFGWKSNYLVEHGVD